MNTKSHINSRLTSLTRANSETAFQTLLGFRSRKPDFYPLSRKFADCAVTSDDECCYEEEEKSFKSLESTEEYHNPEKRTRSTDEFTLVLDQEDEIDGIRYEKECRIEEINKPVYAPLKVPRIRPDSVSKDAINPEEVRYSIMFNHLRGWKLQQYINNWSFITQHDDTRISHAYIKGGIAAPNSVTHKYRSIAKDLIKQIGRQLLSGHFNLSTISFPIKAMVGESVLEKCSKSTSTYPLYMNLALRTKDPLQRFKFVIAAAVSNVCFLEMFAKPLNPILGETFQGYYNDGTRVYLEQISHHPPISYMYATGPYKTYTVFGPYTCSPGAGLNHLRLNAKGWRNVVFNDTKQEIHFTTGNDEYEGTFWGKCVCHMTGAFEFVDKANEITCKLVIGKIKNKLKDYFEGDIKVAGKSVSKVRGTLLGWLEIDENRYFDHRYVNPFELNIEKSPLESDSYKRMDILYLRNGEIDKAQIEKERLEDIQRRDRKLGEKFSKKKH